MILEIARFDITEGEEESFVKATHSAQKVISQSQGFVSVEFQQCIELPTYFIALIKWDTLEDHTIGFRESSLFTEWRAILSPFFNSTPTVLHYKTI